MSIENISNTNNYAALALIVDRSGSMQSVATDVRGSVQQFIGDQKKEAGKATLTVAQFDHQYEVVYNFKDIQEVDEKKFAQEYTPRGSTALLDAIGRTTLAMQKQLDSLSKEEQPKRVVVAIITDGFENASREFNMEQIKQMIKDKEAAGWDFMFMGATLDTVQVAKSMGFSADKSAYYEAGNFSSCMNSVNEKIKQARLNQEVKFSEQERQDLQKKTETASNSAAPAA